MLNTQDDEKNKATNASYEISNERRNITQIQTNISNKHNKFVSLDFSPQDE